jgi:hypothetical protein
MTAAAAATPGLAFTRVLRMDIPSVISQRWRPSSPQAHMAMAVVSLLTGSSSTAQQDAVKGFTQEVATAAVGAVVALGGGGEQDSVFAGAFGRMAAAAAVSSTHDFILKYTQAVASLADDAAKHLPSVVLLRTGADGAVTVASASGKEVVELMAAQSAPKHGALGPTKTQKQARAAAVALVAQEAALGARPAVQVPRDLVQSVLELLRARVAAEKEKSK